MVIWLLVVRRRKSVKGLSWGGEVSAGEVVGESGNEEGLCGEMIALCGWRRRSIY